jgi:hypothetical protein
MNPDLKGTSVSPDRPAGNRGCRCLCGPCVDWEGECRAGSRRELLGEHHYFERSGTPPSTSISPARSTSVVLAEARESRVRTHAFLDIGQAVMAEDQPDPDKPDYHPEPFNWKGVIFILAAAAIMVIVILIVVALFASGHTSSPTSSSVSLRGAARAGSVTETLQQGLIQTGHAGRASACCTMPLLIAYASSNPPRCSRYSRQATRRSRTKHS